eukprot:1054364-Lingulodinium_polyedra.AAC.1
MGAAIPLERASFIAMHLRKFGLAPTSALAVVDNSGDLARRLQDLRVVKPVGGMFLFAGHPLVKRE